MAGFEVSTEASGLLAPRTGQLARFCDDWMRNIAAQQWMVVS